MTDVEVSVMRDIPPLKLVYNLDPIPYDKKLVFLAGPTPRSEDVHSWRGGCGSGPLGIPLG